MTQEQRLVAMLLTGDRDTNYFDESSIRNNWRARMVTVRRKVRAAGGDIETHPIDGRAICRYHLVKPMLECPLVDRLSTHQEPMA